MKTIKEQIQELLNSVENPKDRSKKFYLIKKNLEWYDDLLKKTSFLEFEDVNIATRLYYYLNDKTEIQKCECCGNSILRNCDIDGKTLVYCSRKCSAVGGVDKTKVTKIERYGSAGYMNPEKVRETWKKKSRDEIDKLSEKHRFTSLERYGVESPSQNPEIRRKTIETNLQRYGVDNPSKSKIVIDKIHQTFQERYGVDNAMQIPEVHNKFMESLNSLTLEDKQRIKEQRKLTCLDRYGVEHVSQLDTIQSKISNSHHNRTKEQVEESNRKRTETCLDRYGVEFVIQSKTVKEKSRETLLEKYGVPFPINHKFRRIVYEYDDELFDSSYELYFYIWAKENNHSIVRLKDKKYSFEVDGKTYYYFPDFLFDGKEVEIKGEHFFDIEGNLINPFTRDDRIQQIYKAKGECIKSNGVTVISDVTDQQKYVESKYTSNFISLFRNDLKFPYLNEDFKIKSDMGIIQHFHKSIYEASKEGFLSPVDAWKDKHLVYRSAVNRLKYVGKCRPSDVLQGFNVAKIAPKVSVFDPELAKDLISKYISESTIIDPFSGFSGRLIGSIRNNKSYYGYDLNEKHVQESKEIIEYLLAERAFVEVRDIFETCHKSYTDTALFTCPPYSSKESWNGTQDVNLTCDEWIEECLKRFDCSTYLFVVDKTDKFNYNIVETIENKSHFGTNNEYVVLIKKG